MPGDVMNAGQEASGLLICGVRGSVRQRQDEVLVAHVEVEPRYVATFWQRFSDVGACVGLTPLTGEQTNADCSPSGVTSLDATRGAARQRLDGTLVVDLEVRPTDVPAFWVLFPKVSSEVALAPLLPPYRRPRAEQQDGASAPVGAGLARLAAMLCRQESFWDFLRELPGCSHVNSELTAASAIYSICGIPSRALLDTDARAARIFHEVIRRPYVEYSGAHAPA